MSAEQEQIKRSLAGIRFGAQGLVQGSFAGCNCKHSKGLITVDARTADSTIL